RGPGEGRALHLQWYNSNLAARLSPSRFFRVTTTPASRGLRPRVSIVSLAGFMGSGKTTVGTLLARQLAWRFVDLDERIEESGGLPIPQIFERFGMGRPPDSSRKSSSASARHSS